MPRKKEPLGILCVSFKKKKKQKVHRCPSSIELRFGQAKPLEAFRPYDFKL